MQGVEKLGHMKNVLPCARSARIQFKAAAVPNESHPTLQCFLHLPMQTRDRVQKRTFPSSCPCSGHSKSNSSVALGTVPSAAEPRMTGHMLGLCMHGASGKDTWSDATVRSNDKFQVANGHSTVDLGRACLPKAECQCRVSKQGGKHTATEQSRIWLPCKHGTASAWSAQQAPTPSFDSITVTCRTASPCPDGQTLITWLSFLGCPSM